MHRAVSIPAWTVLREPSEASGALSGDELESRLSSEMVDEIAPTPQPPARRRPPEQSDGPSAAASTSQTVERPVFVEGSSTGGQPSSSTSVPRNPPSPLLTRRPLSDSGSDGDIRPRKKRKKRILNPEQGPAAARTRVSLDGQPGADDTRPIRLSQLPSKIFPALKSSDALREARRQRRVTMDIGIAARNSSQPSASQPERRFARHSDATATSTASQKSIPSLPRSNANAPLQRAQARRRSTNEIGRDARPSNGQTGPSSQRPPPTSAVPPSPEVIEILDSDDDPPPPSLPKAPANPVVPAPQLNIPRRTKYQPNPLPRYKEENGVIILTSDDDEPAAPPKPPAASPPPVPDTGPQETVIRDRAQVSSLRPVAPLPPKTSSPPESRDHRSPVPQTAAQDEVEAQVIPLPVDIRDPQDIEMTEEDPVLPEMPDEMPTNEEPSSADEQPVDNKAATQDTPQDHPPDPHPVAMQEDPPLSTHEPPQEEHVLQDTDTTASSPMDGPPAQTSLPVELSGSTQDLAELNSDQQTSSPSLPTQNLDDTSTAGQESTEKPLPLSDTIPPNPPNQVPSSRISTLAIAATRSETASPVSSMLDPQLQDLAISGPPPGTGQSGQQTPSTSVQPSASSRTTSSSSTSSSLSSPSSRKAAKIRIKAPLYSGPDGFFADVYRLSQKRRQSQTPSSSQSRLAASSSTTIIASPEASSGAAAPKSPDSVKVTNVDSLPASRESSVMLSQRSADSVQVQAKPRCSVVDERIEIPLHTMEAEKTVSLATKPNEDEPSHHPSPQAAEGLQNTCSEEDQPMEESPPMTPGAPTSPRTFPAHPPAPTAALVSVQPELSTDHPSAESDLFSKTPALEASRTEEDASQVGASDTGDNTTRRDTPPVENPEPRSLSQIILKAVSEKARRVVVDLTSEDDLNHDAAKGIQPGLQVVRQAILSELSTSATASTATTTVTPVTPTTSPASERIKTLDLSAFRKLTRRGQRRPPQLSPSKPGEKMLPPLPRNLGRLNGLNKPTNAAPAYSTPSVQPVIGSSSAPAPPPPPSVPVQFDAVAGSSQSDAPPLTSTALMCSPLLSQIQQKPMLPRLRDLMKIAQQAKAQPPRSPPTAPEAADSTQEIPVVVGSSSIEACVPSPSEIHVSPSPSCPSQLAPIVAGAPVEMVDEEATPPRSPSPETVEEEECLSLIYPDSAECTPEVEMAGEPAQEQAPTVRSGRQTRSQAASDASSSASGPRRSARLTSSSAGSSVEPPERPASRSRRYQPYVRTHSDEVVAAQGGITRRQGHSFLQAFASAGFEAISWQKDRRRIAKEFAPVTQLAKDIPHDLHDRMNSLSLAARQAGNMQVLVFEAEIRANTAADEPDAPPVYIVNDVDDEPTPPLEFYYSNLMWHGEGVPKPDHENLQGCDCVGPCDPTSKTCACVKRQRKYWDGGSNGFIYDRKGKLREHEYPIFECNMNCGCSEDCPNRVIQNGRQSDVFIAICKTVNKGWGVFAGHKKIPANTYIGIYAGEYLTDSEGEIRGTIYNKFGRTYLFDLDFWFLNEEDRERKVKYCIDAYHAGNFTRYLNHSCDPNCVINACYINEANMDKPLLAIFTCRDVEPFEELCFSYFGQPDDDTGIDTKPDKDDAVYVTCQCGAPNCRGTMWK